MTVLFTTVCWLADGVSRPADRPRDPDRLLPQGPPVRPRLGAIRAEADIAAAEAAQVRARGQHSAGVARLGGGLRGHLVGLFAVGNFLYGRYDYAFMLLAVFVITGGTPDLDHQAAVGLRAPADGSASIR